VHAHCSEEDVANLRRQVEQRGWLVHQLSQELFQRLVPQQGQQQVLERTLAAQSEELRQLKGELQRYSRVVEQLSAELFHRLRQERQIDGATVMAWHRQIQKLQGELQQVQQELQQREQALVEVQGLLAAARERNQHLETILRDLPEVYRRRFNARLAPVKEQLAQLQEENRRLQAELQRYGALAQTTSRQASPPRIDLPKFPPLQNLSRAIS